LRDQNQKFLVPCYHPVVYWQVLDLNELYIASEDDVSLGKFPLIFYIALSIPIH
jgi:hypothetical protein